MLMKNDGGGSTASPEGYWADLPAGVELASELMKRWTEYQDWLQVSGKLQAMRDSANMYYCRDMDGRGWASRRVRRHRENPGVLKLNSNHYGATARAKVTLITSKPLMFNVVTTNTDSTSGSTAVVGNGILEYVKRRYKLEAKRKVLARHGINYGGGVLSWDWDAEAGDEIPPEKVPPGKVPYQTDPETGEPMLNDDGTPKFAKMPHYGEPVFRNHTPVDYAYDFTSPEQDLGWIVMRHFENKYDLAEKNPKFRDEILAMTAHVKSNEWRLSSYFESLSHTSTSDMIPVYRFVHRRSPALPDGREAYIISDTICLSAGPLEYDRVPYTRFQPESADDAPDGHTDMHDQMGLQEGLNACIGVALSKQQASLPKPFINAQAGIRKQDMGGGFNVFIVNGNPNEVINYVEYESTAKNDVDLASYFQQQIETGTGINSVMRGNPNESIKAESGRAYAFVQAQAAIVNFNPEGALRECMGEGGTGVIDMYSHKHFAEQQVMVITGKSQEAQALTFLGEKDLMGVQAVTVEQGDALTGTPAGRMELLGLFKDLGATGLDAEKIYKIVTEGRWDSVIEDAANIDMHIRTENENLVKGLQIVPLETENHLKHIIGHLAVSNRPGASVRVVTNALQHIRYHIYQWRIADPALLGALGIPVLPQDPLFAPPGAVDPATGMPVANDPTAQPAMPSSQENPGGTPMQTEGSMPVSEEAGVPTPADVAPEAQMPNGDPADPTNQGAPALPELANA